MPTTRSAKKDGYSVEDSQDDPKNEPGAGDAESMPLRWKCNKCKEWHNDLPLAFGRPLPDTCQELKESGKEHLIKSTGDFCVQRDENGATHYFVRGRISLPITSSNNTFVWNVWVSLNEANFMECVDNLDTTGRERTAKPYFGWLCSDLGGVERSPYITSTACLKTNVRTQPVGCVPEIELEPTEHPLAVEQRDGVSLERVQEIAALLMHP